MTTNKHNITVINFRGGIGIFTPYNPVFVQKIKKIDYSNRTWVKSMKVWIVHQSYATYAQRALKVAFGVTVQMPEIIDWDTPEHRVNDTIDVLYTDMAFGYDMSEQRSYWFEYFVQHYYFEQFKHTCVTEVKETYYGILNVDTHATSDDIKKSYRRLARQYHPDVSSEPNALQRFQQINDANEVLSNPRMRKRYDIGLQEETALATHTTDTTAIVNKFGTTSPTSGHIHIDGWYSNLNTLTITKIHDWTPITNDRGERLVVNVGSGSGYNLVFSRQWV